MTTAVGRAAVVPLRSSLLGAGCVVRVLAAGAGLLALDAGAGTVPAAGPGGEGSGSALLRLVAAGALIAAAVRRAGKLRTPAHARNRSRPQARPGQEAKVTGRSSSGR
jgi:hypothetical protein